jgi:DNA-binding XRE family transcriptional regulator
MLRVNQINEYELKKTMWLTDATNFSIDLTLLDIMNDVEWLKLYKKGISLFALTDNEAALAFGVTRTTTCRWRNGNHFPHIAIRRAIIRDFQDMLKEYLEELVDNHEYTKA